MPFGGNRLGTQPAFAPVRFAEFEFDPRTGQLRRDDTPIKLQQQPAKVLAVLLRHPGEVVSRQELAQAIWGSETFVDFEQGLNFAIRHIRTALGDDADRPRFLQTLPKQGYRFIAPVSNPVEQVRTEASSAGSAVTETDTVSGGFSRSKRWVVIGAISALFLITVAVKYRNAGARAARVGTEIRSIAVLPLINLSSDAGQEYFSEGLTDELITELAKVGKLRVISRTSVSGYKGTEKRAPAIAAELHVDAIVEGTVERVGNRVRIRAQLIQASTDQHLWAESYDRDVDNVLALENEVARDIATEIGQHTAPKNEVASIKPAVLAAAHEDYLRGRYYWNKRTEAGLHRGIEYFQKAIDQEPNYALAHAGLADSYIMLANWGFAAPAESYAKAKASALKALKLDPQLAEAHTSLAYITLLYEWDWQKAEEEFRQAIRINPNYASAHQFYSICLMTVGRQSEALAEIQRAQELDPLSLIVGDVYGWIYYEGRQYDRAIEQYKKTLELDSAYVPAVLDLGASYLRKGKYPEALSQFQRARTLAGDNGVVLSSLGQVYALSGQRAKAREILDELYQPRKQTFISAWDISLVHAALGQNNQAIELLGKAADDHVGWVVRLGVDPALDNLRQYPAFQKLTKRLGISADLTPVASTAGRRIDVP